MLVSSSALLAMVQIRGGSYVFSPSFYQGYIPLVFSGVPAPLVRISTCGGMTIEILHKMLEADPPQGRYVVVTPQQRGKGSTTARNLLSALLWSVSQAITPPKAGSQSASDATRVRWTRKMTGVEWHECIIS